MFIYNLKNRFKNLAIIIYKLMTTFISKETISRLLKDVKHILKNPLTENGIYYIHDDTDMMKGYALIIGPSDTPYFGGNYFFEFNYPNDFPHSPPKVKYWTNGNNVRFNPNLYTCGKVCVSLLNTWRGDQWTSCQSISTVLLTLCTLLCKDPLLNEPGVNRSNPDMKSYDEIIQYSNIDIAVCDIIEKKSGVFMPFFENFYPFVKENFLKNYDKLLEFAEKKNIEFNETPNDFRTGFYSMKIKVDYNKVIERLKESKALVEIM
jgi:ubiquitin-conjugating enzyme E2 Z